MKKILGILVLCMLWCTAVIAVTFNKKKDKLPITPELIGEWDYTSEKEGFITRKMQ